MDESTKQKLRTYLFGRVVSDASVDSARFVDVQKVLYLLEQEADSESPVADLWDFYWYLHGPMAASASQASETASQQGMVTPKEMGGGKRFSAPSGEIDAPDELSEELRREIDALLTTALEKYDFEDRFGVAIVPIYENAPVEFYKKYRFDVLEEINAMTSVEPPSSDSLLERIETLEGYLPLSPEWKAENEAYSRLVSVFRQYLSEGDPFAGIIHGNTSLDSRYPPVGDKAFDTNWIEEGTKLSPTDAERLFVRLTGQLWTLIAERARLTTADPEGENESRISGWEADLEVHHEQFDASLRLLEDYTRQDTAPVTRDQLEDLQAPEDSLWGSYVREVMGETNG